MTRYRTRAPRSWDDWYTSDAPVVVNPTVDDHEPTYTGLLDADGNEIWRDPRCVGFHHPREGSEW